MPLSRSALEPLLRVAMVPGVGAGRLALLLRAFGSAERVLAAPGHALSQLQGIGPEIVRRLQEASSPAAGERARRAMDTLDRLQAVAITPDDRAYPDAFRSLADSPHLLFCAGDLRLLEVEGIGVVGTREPTAYGRTAAHRLATDLSTAGLGIVSGMAKGIDACAHAAALSAGGPTVGVLGNGIDQVYPAENRELYRRVRAEGLLITELPPGEGPRAGNFPRRNRLIAALSRGVLVVEMGQRSGALHTVNYALEQGKDVFAVPGPIGSPMSAGTNQLLKEGARLVTTVDDVLEELGGVRAPVVPARKPDVPLPPPQPKAPLPELAPEEARIVAALAAEPRHVDEICVALGSGVAEVLSLLLGLELRGIVEALPGKRFRLA